jgi:serine/threonine protein kinase
VVYRCYQTSLGRTVAIKVLASDLDEASRQRFLREGYAMGRLSGHPNIVNILQVGVTASNRPYIVMPYHRADSLALRMRRSGPIPWPDVLRIGVKLCGALETAHKAGTLHRDIKPGNVLVTDYGEPQLSDFGIARIVGGYQTVTGFVSGTIAFTAPEVLSGQQPTVAADVYSLGATLYALIAGVAAHEHRSGEELTAQYLRIASAPAPDLRPGGIPDDVCTAIERAMSLDPAKRPASAADFGQELQAAQRHNGLPPDSMTLPNITGGEESEGVPAAVINVSDRHSDPIEAQSAPPVSTSSSPSSNFEPPATSGPPVLPMGGFPADAGGVPTRGLSTVDPPSDPGTRRVPSWGSGPPPPEPPAGPPPPGPRPARKKRLRLVALAAAALLLVIGSIYFVMSRGGSGAGNKTATAPPGPQTTAGAQAGWQPITNARVARAEVATTQADGTIWIFGGVGDGGVSGRHEGYDPAIDNWKGGDDLPVPVQHAMSVTWQGNPAVLGGVQSDRATTNRVWRVVNSRWVELPHMLQPRAAAAAAAVGDRIIVTGGVDANGALLKSTEIFDGSAWTPGADIPTPRQMLGVASDGKLVYTLGGTNGNSELTTGEAYDPAANTWISLPALAQPRSDLGVAIADQRLVAVGGWPRGRSSRAWRCLIWPRKHGQPCRRWEPRGTGWRSPRWRSRCMRSAGRPMLGTVR